MKLLFWFSFIVLAYVYAGYPLLMALAGAVKASKRKAETGELEVYPQATLMIAAYNEEKVIRKKLENSLSLDYAAGKLEIMVVSDGSTDATDEIVKEYGSKGVKLTAFAERQGKTVALGRSVGAAGGEIIVFSDANGMYRKDALKKLLRHFRDGAVGCVCGNLLYEGRDRGENLYWKLEEKLKKAENSAGAILGAAGSIFAVRKSAYVPLRIPVVDDFIEPLLVYQNGYGVVFEPEAVSVEKMAETITGEYGRKTRIITRSLAGLPNIAGLFNPFRHGLFTVQLVSHKLLRWLAPFFLIGLFVSSLFQSGVLFYKLALLAQLSFCLLGMAGYFLDRQKSGIRLFSVPLYFLVVNLAALNAWYNRLRGEKMIKWDTKRI